MLFVACTPPGVEVGGDRSWSCSNTLIDNFRHCSTHFNPRALLHLARSSCGSHHSTGLQESRKHIIPHMKPTKVSSAETEIILMVVQSKSAAASLPRTFTYPETSLAFISPTTMAQRSTWIEKDSNGRPYFVRKKPNLPSDNQSLTQGLLPRLNITRSLFSSFRNSDKNNSGDVKSCLALPSPNSSDPSSAQAPQPTVPMAPNSNAQPLPVNMYLLPPQSNQNVHESNGNNNNQQSNPFHPANHFVPMPMLPGMFPAPPPPMPTQSQNLFPSMPFPPQHTPFPVPLHNMPPGTVPVPGQPHGLQSQPPAMPAAPPAQADMRYKCEICGRYRSAHYHYNHPIPPGQLPGKTICRKCRKEATDSEETSSSGSYRETRSRCYHSRGPARKYRHRSRSRAQPREHTRLIDEGYARHSATSLSEFDTSSPDRRRSRSTRHRYRRPGTPGTELVRRTRGLRLSPLGERTYDDPRTLGHNHHHFERGRQEREVAHRSRSRFRTPSNEPRIIRRQYSDPFMSSSHVENPAANHASPAYLDGSTPTYQRQSYSPQRGPRPPWERSVSISGYRGPPAISPNLNNSDAESDGKFRRRVRSKSRSRSRSRSTRHRRSGQRRPSSHYHEGEHTPWF